MKNEQLTPEQACTAYLTAQKELKALKEPIKDHVAKISKQERVIKKLKEVIVTGRNQISKDKWDLVIDSVDVPAYSYKKITTLVKR